MGLNIWNYEKVNAIVSEVYSERKFLATKSGGVEAFVKKENLCYVVNNKKYINGMRNFYGDYQGDKVSIFINTNNPGGIIARGRFEILWALKNPLFYICVFAIIFLHFLEINKQHQYKHQMKAKQLCAMQKQKEIEEFLGRRDNTYDEDDAFFDKLCINSLGRSIPTEIDWILRYGDISKFDKTFLFKKENGVYEFISETLRLQREGLPQDYLVFQITGDRCFAINFDDNQVYSFVTDKFEEPLLQGNFVHYLKNFFQDNK